MRYKSFRTDVKKTLDAKKLGILEDIGAELSDYAYYGAPVDTGDLRDSVDYEVDKKDLSVSVGANTDYAIHVEKGTSTTDAQPFIVPAFTDNEKLIEKIIKENMRGD